MFFISIPKFLASAKIKYKKSKKYALKNGSHFYEKFVEADARIFYFFQRRTNTSNTVVWNIKMQEKKACKNLRIKKVTIVGVIPSFAFQRAKYCALELHRKLPQRFPLPDIVGLLELDWSEKLQEWRQTMGREYWCLRRPVAVFFDDKFIGSDIELIKLTTIGNILMENIPRRSTSFIKEHFRKDYISYLRKTKRIYCYLDICIDDVYVGTLTFQLYSDLLPRTCENFKTLCIGSRGPLLSYRGSRIHRIVKGGWLQGGDIQFKTGGGGYSIFCDPLEDECFGISHDRRGVLSMANAGRHSNGSQFFITLNPSKWMDTHYVAFGQLIEGVRVLKTLECLETFYECPLKKIEIKSCGKLDMGDVEDVDVMYKEEPMPAKKRKKIETISEQVIRLIMEALTDALARKEYAPDILDDGDVPSKMNLQLYFQGFYSLPESILEESAKYLRNLRRQLLRVVKPSATEIVEVIMYDLLMAVLTRMTTLDDIRETIGHNLYQKMISGIDMNLELCQKPYVKRLVDQIVSTAESMVDLVSRKIQNMKNKSVNLKKFQERMQMWVQSFVLQETFKGDNYFIADRSPSVPKEEEKVYPKREGKPCCDEAKKKKEQELMAKLRSKFGSEDLCCLGSKLLLTDGLLDDDVNLYDYFSTCRYDLKRVPKIEEERMPLLDMIEFNRFKLRVIRQFDDKVKSEERLCVEKKIRKWMSEIVYTPETAWLKDVLYPKDCLVLDHMEEIMYGAMTAGLLEMYYYMEQYLKVCGGKRQKLVTRTLYPEDSGSSTPKEQEEEKPKEEEEETKEEEEEQKEVEETRVPCPCGHPCCKCPFDPNYKAPSPPPPSLEEEGEGEFEEFEESLAEAEPPSDIPICASDETLVDLNAELTAKVSLHPEEIDIRSFKWLKPYIIEKGCDLKTQFVTQVHKWLDGETFNYRGFISKHSLVTRASLLSLSISLTELIKEENNLKSDLKNFIYDLWALYFEEMFKEALLEYPPEKKSEVEVEGEGEGEMDLFDDLSCKKIMEDTPQFDFDTFCGRFDEPGEGQFQDLEIGGEDVMEGEDKTEDVPQVNEPETTEPQPPDDVGSPPRPDTMSGASESPQEEFEGENKSELAVRTDEEAPIKKRRSPIVIEELVDVSSGDEERDIPPYVLPFWVKFLTEMTKQALGAIAKVSRLPRRLYLQTDSEVDFDEKMKDWFEFNAFNPQPTKGREIMDYIALHHRSLTNLEETARSYLKKKKYSELLNRCTRITSADQMADEIVADVIDTAMDKTGETETVELFVSNLLSSAITSSPVRSQASIYGEDDNATIDTDQRDSYDRAKEEDDD